MAEVEVFEGFAVSRGDAEGALEGYFLRWLVEVVVDGVEDGLGAPALGLDGDGNKGVGICDFVDDGDRLLSFVICLEYADEGMLLGVVCVLTVSVTRSTVPFSLTEGLFLKASYVS